MSSEYITIGDLEQVDSLQDEYKLLIDDSTNGDTKSALVSVLKTYITNDIKPSINKDTGTWFIGTVDTGIKVVGGVDIWEINNDYEVNDFVCYEDMIYRCIVSPQVDKGIFNETEWVSMSSKIEFGTNQNMIDMINEVWEGAI